MANPYPWTAGQTDVDIANLMAKSLFDANSILMATSDDTPVALTVAEQTLIGRITGGAIASLTVAQIKTLLGVAAASGIASLSAGTLVVENPANATATPTASKIPIADGSGLLDGWVTLAGLGGVAKALYDAYTILMATADDTPVALTVAEQTLVGRITGGVIAALTVTQLRTLLNLAEGTHIADPTGGAVIDTEARTTINAILVRLEEKDINNTV